MEFKRALCERAKLPAIVETDSLFASRIQEDQSVWIRGIKQWTLYSSWNKSQTRKHASIIRRFFPNLGEADTPLIDSIIGISSMLLKRDFVKEGRTLAKLGWDDLSHSEILKNIYE